jgi:hypothetical protein
MDYTKDILIDQDALDVEWLNQPSLAMKYGKNWACCVEDLARAEEHLKIVQADLVDMVNQNPTKYLGEGIKPTIGNIDAYVIRHEDYKTAKDEVIKRQYEVNVANIAKMEIGNSRKSALENLVRLHGQNYFAGPSVPRDLSKEALKVAQSKRADNAVSIGMKRNKQK